MAQETMLYEAMYILDPDLSEEEVEQVINDIHRYVEANNGEVVSDEFFGQRRLAYEIGGYTEGIYRILYFRGDGTTVGELRHEFGLIEPVIRGMVVTANPEAIYKSPEAPAGPAEEEAEEPAEPVEPIPAEEEAEEPAEPVEPIPAEDQEAETAEQVEVDEAVEMSEEAPVPSESEAPEPSASAPEETSEEQSE